MTIVSDVLKHKGRQVWSVRPEATVLEALKLMAEKEIGAVLVLEGERLLGVFSERDYARKVVLHGLHSREVAVREVMTGKVLCVRPEQTIEECMALMTAMRVRHLPVIEGERVRGLISIGDVVKSIISEQEFIIDQLATYIGVAR